MPSQYMVSFADEGESHILPKQYLFRAYTSSKTFVCSIYIVWKGVESGRDVKIVGQDCNKSNVKGWRNPS